MTRITLDSLPENWLDRIVHVPETDCWVWTGSTAGPSPHACVTVKRVRVYLHKHLWTLANPDFDPSLPLPRLFRHCTTPLCVNPEHWHHEPFRPEDPWTPHVLGRRRKDPEAEQPFIPAPVSDFNEGDFLEIAINLIDSLLDYDPPGSLEEICALPQFSGIPETIVATAAQHCGLRFPL